MTYARYDSICQGLIFLSVVVFVGGTHQNSPKPQQKISHLPQTKFSFNEYSEYTDSKDREGGPQAPKWDQEQHKGIQLSGINLQTASTFTNISDNLDPNIVWNSKWAADQNFGQLSAVSIDPNGNVAVFHRGERTWGYDTFDDNNKFDKNKGPIKQNTIVLLNKNGDKIVEWGKNMFYLPHGLTIDSFGNYWVTDVALHQVFKFDVKDIQQNLDQLKREQSGMQVSNIVEYNSNDPFENSLIKPSMILGEAFVPGNDAKRFCKPTAVAVQKDGVFFVSDGYCNSRIIKFNKKGERILTWGRKWGPDDAQFQPPPNNAFYVPHSLALSEELQYIFVADRENGRILCFNSMSGKFHREYKDPVIGTKVYSVAYTNKKIYLVNGPDPFDNNRVHKRGFVMDITSGKVVSQFKPGEDLRRPHDIAVSEDGREIYIVELDPYKIHKFSQGINETLPDKKANSLPLGNSTSLSSRHEPAPLTDDGFSDSPAGSATVTTVVSSLITASVVLIAVCVAIAAVVAKCRKRGCLLTMQRRMRWEAERKENFKLSSLLENRKIKGFKFLDKRPNTRDFSKLNTEPETSEDEHPENSLTKVI